jgi:hypothetical protein
VPGELVSLHVTLQVADSKLGTWRRDQAQPRRSDDMVATWHLGHLLDPPRWLDWNLASAPERDATIADISTTLLSVGLPFVDALVEDLKAEAEPASLAGRVDSEALLEYYVGAGRQQETAPSSRRCCRGFTNAGGPTSSTRFSGCGRRACPKAKPPASQTASNTLWFSSTCRWNSADRPIASAIERTQICLIARRYDILC